MSCVIQLCVVIVVIPLAGRVFKYLIAPCEVCSLYSKSQIMLSGVELVLRDELLSVAAWYVILG